MKLVSLCLLSNYKNIQAGSLLQFSGLNYTALVGANGSGKSNWIEAVAAVMLHLLENRAPGFDYRLFVDDAKEISWQGGQKQFRDNLEVVDGGTFILPKKLVVSYSGEDHRLWNDIMMDSYARYFKDKEMDVVEEPDAIYINRYQWAIALITLMCSQKQEVVDFVTELWGQRIPLNEIQVAIDIDPNSTGYKATDSLMLLEQIKSEDPLYMSHIASFDIGVDKENNMVFCQRLFYLLYALSMPVPDTKKSISLRKVITNIEITASNGHKLAGLSEGHKKRILLMLMTQIIGNDQTVYLLDEPDAHVDVAAKTKVLSLIANAPGHTLLTTHSPLMTHNMKPEAVRTVKDGDADKEEWKKVIEHLSDNQFASVNNFLFTLKRKVIITEGKFDVYYIRTAVKQLSVTNPDLEKLNDVALFSFGGTGDIEYFLKNSLEPVIGYLDKVVILFDKDSAGKGGFDKTVHFVRDNGLDSKVVVFKYAQDYPDSAPEDDFYVEDYFDPSCYLNKNVEKDNIREFNLNGQPPYYEMKKMAQQCGAIKSFLERNYESIELAAYAGFLPLLNKLITDLVL